MNTEELEKEVSALSAWVADHKKKSTKHDAILWSISIVLLGTLVTLIYHILTL